MLKRQPITFKPQLVISIELWTEDGSEKLLWHDTDVKVGDTIDLRGFTVREIVKVDDVSYGVTKMASFEVPMDGKLRVRLHEEKR